MIPTKLIYNVPDRKSIDFAGSVLIVGGPMCYSFSFVNQSIFYLNRGAIYQKWLITQALRSVRSYR